MARSFLSNGCVSRKGIGLLSASVNSQMVNKSSFGSWRSRLRWRLLRPVVTASTMLPEDVIVIWPLIPARSTTVEHVLTCYAIVHVSYGKGGVSVAQRGLEIEPDGKWGSQQLNVYTSKWEKPAQNTRTCTRLRAWTLHSENNIAYPSKHHATGYAVYTILHIFRPAVY